MTNMYQYSIVVRRNFKVFGFAARYAWVRFDASCFCGTLLVNLVPTPTFYRDAQSTVTPNTLYCCCLYLRCGTSIVFKRRSVRVTGSGVGIGVGTSDMLQK